MVIVGLLLILLGAIILLLAIFTADIEQAGLEYMGIHLSPLALFLLGVAAGAAILWGFAILKYGTKRTLRQRREQKRLEELSDKLDRVDRERDGDLDEGRNRDGR